MKRWAVVGTGAMAKGFIEDARRTGQCEFIAVSSHQLDRAEEFAMQLGITHAFDSIEAMCQLPEIDVVYIANTHIHHVESALQALTAGKAVLVEKPLALTEAEATLVYNTAEQHHVFCAEALWTRFSPNYLTLVAQLNSDRIGELRHIQASFGFPVSAEHGPKRLLDPHQAGGALLDIGIYPLLLPLFLWGEPDEISGHVQMSAEGVDIASDITLVYKDGKTAQLAYRFDCHMPITASISGTNGHVSVPSPWFASNALQWVLAGEPATVEYTELSNRGWGYEVLEVNRCIDAGLLQSPLHNWQDSKMLARVMQRIREQFGIRYPFEQV